MIKVQPYKKGDVYSVKIKDVFYADFETKEKSEAVALKENNCAYTFLIDDKIIGVGGFNLLWPGVAEGWTVLSEDVKKYPILFHKLVLKGIQFHMHEMKLHRVHSTVVSSFCTGGKWLQKLGFNKEGTLNKFGSFGDSYDLWARVI